MPNFSSEQLAYTIVPAVVVLIVIALFYPYKPSVVKNFYAEYDSNSSFDMKALQMLRVLDALYERGDKFSRREYARFQDMLRELIAAESKQRFSGYADSPAALVAYREFHSKINGDEDYMRHDGRHSHEAGYEEARERFFIDPLKACAAAVAILGGAKAPVSADMLLQMHHAGTTKLTDGLATELHRLLYRAVK